MSNPLRGPWQRAPVPLHRQTWPLRVPAAVWSELTFQAGFALLHLAAIGLHAAAVLHHAWLAVEACRRRHPLNWSSDDY